MTQTQISQKLKDTEHVLYSIQQRSRHSEMSTSFGSFDTFAEANSCLNEIGAIAHPEEGWFPAEVIKTRVLTTVVVTKWVCS